MKRSGFGSERQRSTAQFIQYAMLVGVLLIALPARAQNSAHIVEWDLPMRADASPGAILVDNLGDDRNRLWFVTRLATGGPASAQRVIRLDPAKSLMKGNAQWKSWSLAEDSVTTGGTKRLRASRDRRFIFVRTATSIQRIDTNCAPQTCERIEWFDQVGSINVSDLVVNDSNSVFTTAAVGDPLMPTLAESYVQRLTPGSVPAFGQTANATVTRWQVGGGAGFCADISTPAAPRTTTSFPCLSGIALLDSDSSYPDNRNLVFYSEPEGTDGIGNIGELNISTNRVRRWTLSTLPPDPDGTVVQQPRQLIIDRYDIVWVITGSGHLVSLDLRKNRMRKHAIPLGVLSDPFGLAPDDDVVGYTDSGQNKVGMLFPKGGQSVVVTPTVNMPAATRSPATFPVEGQRANVDSGSVSPEGKVVEAVVTRRTDGDVFVEAQLDSANPNNPSSTPNDSTSPLGITPNMGKGEGTFFYAVGAATEHPTVNRVGFVRLPKPEYVGHPRDDDDAEDGWDHNSHPLGWHISAVDDDDDDGLENALDLPTAREDVYVVDEAPAIAGGQSADFPVTTSPTSLALIATAAADDLLAQIGVEIYDGLGVLVAASAPALGVAIATVPLPAAGTYTVRVRNYGVTSITHTPRLIVREPWVP